MAVDTIYVHVGFFGIVYLLFRKFCWIEISNATGDKHLFSYYLTYNIKR